MLALRRARREAADRLAAGKCHLCLRVQEVVVAQVGHEINDARVAGGIGLDPLLVAEIPRVGGGGHIHIRLVLLGC